MIAEAFVRVRPDTTLFRRETTTQVTRDVRAVERQLASTNREFARFGRGALVGTGALGGLGRAAAFASTAFIGGAGLTFAIHSTIDAAKESERVLAQTQNAVVRAGLSWDRYGERVRGAALETANLSGFDDERLLDTFSRLVRRTGDVNESLRLNALAADVARGANIQLESAAKLVLRASVGQARGLAIVGIQAEKGATSVELLNEISRKYAGSAAAYGKTAAGAQDRFNVALENTQELIGQAVLPGLTKLLDKASQFLNDPGNQQRIQQISEDVVARGEHFAGIVGRLGRAVANFNEIRGRYLQGFKDEREAYDKQHAAILRAIADYGHLGTAAKTASDLIEDSRRAAADTLTGRAPRSVTGLLPSVVRGAGFVGRPLTLSEQLDIALAADPDNTQALAGKRAQYEKALAYAKQQVELGKGNTAQWAKDIAGLSGDITTINQQLAGIAKENRDKAEADRLAAIENLLPGSLSGTANAPGAFERLRRGILPQRLRGRGIADISAFTGVSEAQREAALRTQIAEQRVTNEKKLIPLLQDEVKLAAAHARLLERIGAKEVDKLNATLTLAQLRRRIRDIQKQDAADSFSVQDLFTEGARQFAALGSNVAPLTGILSPQEAGGAAVRAARTNVINQHFYGEQPNPAQAVQQASQAARALR